MLKLIFTRWTAALRDNNKSAAEMYAELWQACREPSPF